jgi:hypothetical protein
VNGFYLSHKPTNSAAMALRGGGGLSRHSEMLPFLRRGNGDRRSSLFDSPSCTPTGYSRMGGRAGLRSPLEESR